MISRAKRRPENDVLLPPGAKIALKPDWTCHAKAASFEHNDQMLGVLPIGVIVFACAGISANLTAKAKMLSIPV